MILSRKVPSQADLKHLGSFDLAFMSLTGHVEWMDPFDSLFFAQKAVWGHGSKEYLWGPEADLLSKTLAAAWKKVGAEHVKRIQAAFDLSGDVSVSDAKLKKALAGSKKLGKQMWLACGKKVRAIVETTVGRAQVHFDRQRSMAIKAVTAAGWEGALAAASTDHVQAYMTQYPDRILHPEVQRLAELTRVKPAARTIDRIQLRDRIGSIHGKGEQYFANMSDVQVGRTWTNTGIQMAHEQKVTEYMVVSEGDAQVCPACKRLHGKHFPVGPAYDKMQQGMQTTNPDKLNKLFPFPRVKQLDNKSTKQIRAMNLQPPFHGKCYIDGTEVYTDKGWLDFKDVTGTEQFLSRKENGELEWVHAVGRVENVFEGELYELSTNSFELCVTPDHDQPYERRVDRGVRGRKYEYFVDSIEKVVQLPEYRIPRTGKWLKGLPVEKMIGDFAVKGATDCTLREFATFLGWYLSEGSTTLKKDGTLQISIAQNDPGILVVKRAADAVAGHGNCHIGKGKVYIYNDPLAEYLMQFGKSHEKWIPGIIKNSSMAVIKHFLDAYLQGDGSESASSWNLQQLQTTRKRFDTSSPRMAGDLGELILKVGGYPSFAVGSRAGTEMTCPRTGKTYKLNHDVYRVGWNSNEFASSQAMQVGRVKYKGTVRCVTLERNHVLWVRYKGKTCFSGNCRCDVVFLWRQVAVERETFIPRLTTKERKEIFDEAAKKGQFAVWRIADPKYSGKVGILKDAKGESAAFVQYRRVGEKFGKVIIDDSVGFGSDNAWRANRIKSWKEAYRATATQGEGVDDLLISRGVRSLSREEMEFFRFEGVRFRGKDYWRMNGVKARKWIDEKLPEQWERSITTIPKPAAVTKPKVVELPKLVDSPEERYRICKEIADRGWTKYTPANLRNFEEGTEHIPIEVLDELNKKGFKARWVKKVEGGGAHHDPNANEVVFGVRRGYDTVAHEVGHAVDNLASGGTRTWDYLHWKKGVSPVNLEGDDAEKLRRAALKWTKGRANRRNKWGWDFYEDNGVDAYDFRTYHGEIGVEWWAMNSERYAKYRRRLVECDKKWLGLKKKYPEGIPEDVLAKAPTATNIERQWIEGKLTYQEMREKFAAEGSKWARARRCYGDTLEIVEKAYLKPRTLVDDIDWVPTAAQ